MAVEKNCDHNCENCEENCESRAPQKDKLNELSSVKKVIGVVSGKGGVGKSLVTSLMSVTMKRRDARVAILDADVTGPSIPKMFGLKERAQGTENALFPVTTKTGIDVMSLNLLMENETDPVVWRGPVISGVIRQFWTDVIWKDIDYMFVDMPPGTGDVPLTVFQSIPVDGIIVVTTPQDLVSMIVAKAINMAKLMNVPVIGIVENMSYYVCPECGAKNYIFGKSSVEETAKDFGIKNVSRIPINPDLARECDSGLIELFNGDYLDDMADAVEKI
jgi:Mrp family chromosome partitioning ATPase